LSQEPYNFNTRAAGISTDYALIEADQVLVRWAEEIVCMSRDQADEVMAWPEVKRSDKAVLCLDIPDQFRYRDPQLIELIKIQYDAAIAAHDKAQKEVD
jgi:predicted protein tyrosine phosphatase